MIFPSVIFLFAFLPAMLAGYYLFGHIICRKNIRVKNLLLLAGSLFFYAWGEGKNVILLIVSAVMNYVFALLVDSEKQRLSERARKAVVAISVICNIGLLFVYKYLDFTIGNINFIFKSDIPLAGIALPIGISFFTFQALSYVVDVYRGNAKVQRNPLDVALYIALFPQLVAGPIVRYADIAAQIIRREESVQKFVDGTERFIVGVCKKILIADTVSLFAYRMMGHVAEGDNISPGAAWLGAVCFLFCIYFDFSGYSDMAIGLGEMFGFKFAENFNYPYVSTSVTEFWRRWHISLGSWFRDYVYIPLGGNRCSKARNFLNLFIVWFLTGFWHGANWTFIFWGLENFALLLFERKIKYGKKLKFPLFFSYVYSLLAAVFGWVIFFSPDLPTAFRYIGQMFYAKGTPVLGASAASALFYLKDNILFFIAAAVFSTPVGKKIDSAPAVKRILLIAAFMVCIVYILKGGYSPFIYFNF
ncbi:MAG: MBOAT family protein [Lachnospiraceae bacterium]|nr:MBOAT family protein [Lachnospiraceae bacterium]